MRCENPPLSSDHSSHFPVDFKLFERDGDRSDQIEPSSVGDRAGWST
jgi:hypothetical protein